MYDSVSIDLATTSSAAGPISVEPSVAFYVTLVMYSVAVVFQFCHFFRSPAWMGKVATTLLVLAFSVHSVEVSLRGVEGVHPGTSVREALGFLAWFFVGVYLLAYWRYRVGMLGVFVSAAAAVLLALARLSPSGEVTDGLTALGRVHISLATVGVGIFAIATGLSLTYLLGDRALRRKRFDGVFFRRGLALETIDKLVHRMVVVGFPVFTIAIMLGVFWAARRADGFNRPEYPLALATWLSFAVLIVTRTAWGWRGRRSAWLTIAGFVSALAVFTIYLLRRVAG